MTSIIYLPRARNVQKNLKILKEKLKVNIKLEGHKITIDGPAIEEYTAEKVFEAIQFGFSVNQALQLTDPDMQFVKINIKKATRRKNLEDVRSRVIGREGKTKRTLENISGCEIVISDENEVGIIGYAEAIEATTTGLKNVIKGSKQSNVYSYMERMNVERKKHKTDDLGIKDDENNKKKESEDIGEDFKDDDEE